MITELFFLMVLSLIASAIGTVSGFGLSTIMVPVLLFFFPAAEALLLAGMLHWFNDIWKLQLFRAGIRMKFLLLFGIPGVFFTFLGARLVFDLPSDLLARLLGVFLIAYTIFLVTHRVPKLDDGGVGAVIGGAISGFAAGLFGVGGAIRAAFLSAYRLPKEVYIATLGAIGLLIDSVRITTYIASGATLADRVLLGLIVFVPATYLGAKFGKHVVSFLPERQFRLVIGLFLLLAGMKFLLYP